MAKNEITVCPNCGTEVLVTSYSRAFKGGNLSQFTCYECGYWGLPITMSKEDYSKATFDPQPIRPVPPSSGPTSRFMYGVFDIILHIIIILMVMTGLWIVLLLLHVDYSLQFIILILASVFFVYMAFQRSKESDKGTSEKD